MLWKCINMSSHRNRLRHAKPLAQSFKRPEALKLLWSGQVGQTSPTSFTFWVRLTTYQSTHVWLYSAEKTSNSHCEDSALHEDEITKITKISCYTCCCFGHFVEFFVKTSISPLRHGSFRIPPKSRKTSLAPFFKSIFLSNFSFKILSNFPGCFSWTKTSSGCDFLYYDARRIWLVNQRALPDWFKHAIPSFTTRIDLYLLHVALQRGAVAFWRLKLFQNFIETTARTWEKISCQQFFTQSNRRSERK